MVQKRNILNELRSNSMTLQELRFFSIYLGKINAKDVNTRVVRFPMEDFQAIMEFGRLNMKQLKATANSLLSKVVNIPDERGGFIAFQLFKECTVSRDDIGDWYVEIDAHDKALPLMFEFKNKYFTYQLWNALRLKSSNQLRMYEILKQYQTIGYRILTIEELKELLGIGKDEYSDYKNFRVRVLDACQQALAEHTDIKYSYEPHGKRGVGGKVLALKFTIEANTDYVDQLTLDMFVEEKREEIDNEIIEADYLEDDESYYEETPYTKQIKLLKEVACENEFSEKEIIVLYDELKKILPYEQWSGSKGGTACCDYLREIYNDFKRKQEEHKGTGNEIKKPFAYFRTMVRDRGGK